MKVLVDTSVWSLALRKNQHKLTKQETLYVNDLLELINEARAEVIGPIKQELLSGVKNEFQFYQLKKHMTEFENIIITADDYEHAALLYSHCRKKGIQGSHIDFLICAVAQKHNLAIFTTDKDFINYAKCVDIILYKPRSL